MKKKEEIETNKNQNVEEKATKIIDNLPLKSNNVLQDIDHTSCSCTEALDKFIVSTAVNNDNFHIQGSFFETKTIHITYSGKLVRRFLDICDKDRQAARNIYIYYCYDNKWDDKQVVKMDICKKHSDLAYCTNIHLPHKGILYIAFTDGQGNWDTDTNSTYFFKVYQDKEKEIIQRYGLDKKDIVKKGNSSSLTIYGQPFSIYLKNIVNKIERFFSNALFGKNY